MDSRNLQRFTRMTLGVVVVCLGASIHAAQARCIFPNGDKTSVGEMASSIKSNREACTPPWRALKRVAADPIARKRLEIAYADIASKYPEEAIAARARSADVAAAAGDPGPMLAIADANVIAHPEDKTLANMSCWARAARGFDIQNAMPFCDAAVANGRPGYALLNRGKLELQLGQFREALRDFNEALGKKESIQQVGLTDAAFGRGMARLRLGDDGGRKDIDLAIEANPSVLATFADFGMAP
jgi:hypothetical protein